ncbi:hypothetical protein [Actinomarinicola tropica]|uniref:Uncharacterized protein n=1 Tax=Actinomarinicola tropica TaxID=2789776 RepID=A0A5Q2R9W5_9ACTN|nr:hypothetical protein [Actinomarinicola tropica]QGG93679.1 hypothetical protein GH723_00320 [Actinomarinicola tropica]
MSDDRAVEDRRRDRVAVVHRQTRPTLLAAAAFLVAAPVAAVVPHSTGVWLPLHLLLVGALLSAISGATQMLAVTWSTSPAPSDRAVALQRAAVVAGTLLLVSGREAGSDLVAAVGGTLVGGGVLLLAGLLVGIRRTATTDRYGPAIDGYLVALAFGVVGIAVGVHLATGGASTDLRAAHLVVNLLGLVGGVILATLPFFAATQVRAKMSPRATAGRIRAWVATSAILVAGAASALAIDLRDLAAVLLVAEGIVVVSVLALLPRVGARQLSWSGPRLVQLIAGVVWWALGAAALGLVMRSGGDDAPVLRALAIGGFAQILVASLAYLGPVLRGGGHEQLSDGFATTRSWIGVGAANVAAAAALLELELVLALGLVAWALDGAVRGVRLLSGWRRRP